MYFIQSWKHILDTDENFYFNYPNLTIIVKITLLILFSNAHVERIFSQTNEHWINKKEKIQYKF